MQGSRGSNRGCQLRSSSPRLPITRFAWPPPARAECSSSPCAWEPVATPSSAEEDGATAFFDYPGGQGQEGAGEEVQFLADSSDDDWAVVRNHTEIRRFRAGEVVIASGEVDRALYIVASGSLEVVAPKGSRGRGKRMATVDAGSVIGEMAFFDGKPRSALVRALTDVRLFRLGFDAFEVLAAKEPALARAILLDLGRILAHRLRTADAFIAAAGR